MPTDEAHPWGEIHQLTAAQVRGVRRNCAFMIQTTWPEAPLELIELGVEIIAPRVLEAAREGSYNMDADDEAGAALRGLFEGYKAVTPLHAEERYA